MKKLLLLLQLFLVTTLLFSQGIWQDQINTNAYFTDIAFSNASNGWAIAPAPGSTSATSGLFYTTDGGNTWNTNNSFVHSLLTTVHFFSDSIGVLCGSNSAGFTVIYRTTDKGVTWTTSSITNPPFNSEAYGITPYGNGSAVLFGHFGLFYHTTDQGATWAPFYNQGPPTITAIHAVEFDNDTIYIASEEGIYKGRNSNFQRVSSKDVYGLAIINNDIYALNDSSLLISNDYGQSWNSQLSSPLYQSYGYWQSLEFSSSNELFVSGSNRQIFRYNSNQNNWISESPRISTGPSSIRSIKSTPNGLWAVGQGLLLKRGSTTEINELNKNLESFAFYPNPAENKIYFDSNFDLIEIYDLSGQLVNSYSNPRSTIDLSELQSGIYLLKAHDGNDVSFQKVVKE